MGGWICVCAFVRACGTKQDWLGASGQQVTLFCVGKIADRRRRWSTGRKLGDYTRWRR